MSTAPNGKIAHAMGVGARTTGAAGHAPSSSPAGSATSSSSVDKTKIGPKSITVDKGGKGGKPKLTGPERRKELMIVALTAVVVLGAGAGVYSYFRSSDNPKIDPIRRVGPGLSHWEYIASSEFDQEAFRRKRILIEDLFDHKKDVEKEFLAGKLKEPTYKTLLSYFWIAKKWKEIDKYDSKSEREKRDYIDHLVDEELTPEIDKKDPRLTKIKRDSKETKAIMERFPPEKKVDITQFKDRLDEAVKDRVKRDKKAAAEARQAQTRPTSRPTAGAGGAAATPPKPAAGH